MAIKQTAAGALPRAGSRPLQQPAIPEPVSVVEYGGRRTLIVLGVMMAALLQTLDATIVNVALPTIEGNIGASIDDGTWIITGYIISNVVAIPLAPFFLQRFGRRNFYAACVIGFTVASVLCGTATSLTTLVLYRVIQGAFGGGLISTAQIILRTTFPPEKAGASAALFAIALTLGPALGPTLGGVLTDQFSWQWVFDINLVPGVLSAIIILMLVRNPETPRYIPFDGAGLAFLVLALGSMQYVLDEGERDDWFNDGTIVFFCATFVVGLTAFIVWELYGASRPVVDLRVFRYRNVQFGTLAAVVMGMVIFGPIVIFPQYVQDVLGFTATLSGLLILMRALPVLVMTPLVARLTTKGDFRLLLCIGFAGSALSLAAIALHMTPQSDFGSFAWALIFSGVAQSMLLVPLLVGLLGSVKPIDMPKVSSFISLSVQLGGSIASTMLVTVLDRRMSFHSDIDRGAITLANLEVARASQHGANLTSLFALLRAQAANAGFADAVFTLAPLAACGVVLALLLRRSATPAPVPIVAAE
jgi:DHA2 family multidrug resistance protein